MGTNIKQAIKSNKGATIFACNVYDPSMYGVVKLSKNDKPLSIIEKPKKFISNYAVTGLYIYDKHATDYVTKIKKSKRNELEITDINKIYLKKNKLNVQILNRGSAWLDMGTFDLLSNASDFVKTIETRQGFMISCPEEIAWRNSWIDKEKLFNISKNYKNSYGLYLRKLLNLDEN